jgi:hypothetical protein
MNRSNIEEPYSLFNQDACTATDCYGEIETVRYGETLKMNQDRIIPIFLCQKVETFVSQYCGYWSSAGIIRYFCFRAPKPLECTSSWNGGSELAHH